MERGKWRQPDRKWRQITALLVIAALFAGGCGIRASQPTKITRIGYLDGSDAISSARLEEGFRQGLREVGLIDGENAEVVYVYAEGHEDRLPMLAADFVGRPVDVIVTTTTQATKVAQRTTSTIPIVFAGLADPITAGIVESLANPGGNATGTTTYSTQLHGKRLQILKETVPGLTRVAVLANPSSLGNSKVQLSTVAPTLDLELLFLEVTSSDQFAAAFDAAIEGGAGALLTLPDALFFSNRALLRELARDRHLPDAHFLRDFASEGALMSYGANRQDSFRRTAYIVDKILKGARPSDLPVELASSFELFINVEAARFYGLTVPPQVLLQADEVIQ